MINSTRDQDVARGAARLRNALLFLGEPESAAALAILRALDSAREALQTDDPAAAADPYPYAAGALISLLDTVAREYRKLGE